LYNKVLTEFAEKYSHDLIIECFGPEASLYAEDFKITESFYKRYKTMILDNLDIIEGKDIVDIGSATGVWGILMLMSGAKSVTCIEPRKKYSHGLGRFAKKHNMAITAIEGFHTAVFDLDKKYDTVTMMGIIDLIPDTATYLSRLDSVCNHVMITHPEFEDVNTDGLRIKLHYNLDHRAGFNFKQLSSITGDLGYQTDIFSMCEEGSKNKGQYVCYQHGATFFKILAESMGYKVLRNYIPKDLVIPGRSNHHRWLCYRIYILELN
jgi:hypothetical protein